MYCKKCGATVSEDTVFCPICNHQIRQEEITEDTKIPGEENKAEQNMSRFVFTPVKQVRKHTIPRTVKIAVPICALCLVCGALVWTGIVNKKGETDGLQVADDAVFSIAGIVQKSADERIAEAESLAETIMDANTEQEENTKANSEKETESDAEQTEAADAGGGEAQGTTGKPLSGSSSNNNMPGADVIGGEDTRPSQSIFGDMASFENEFWSKAVVDWCGYSYSLPEYATVWVTKELYNQIEAANRTALNQNADGEIVQVIGRLENGYYYGDDRYSLTCSPSVIQNGLATGEIIAQEETVKWNTYPEPTYEVLTRYYVHPSTYEQYRASGAITRLYIWMTGTNGVMDYAHEYQICGYRYTDDWH